MLGKRLGVREGGLLVVEIEGGKAVKVPGR
ncbi:hypothetical protein Pogu_1666 [Pyrobaculum oguniense TE7]|uniref:Uncharacterized protein n=1 Tax=Pyrobaculum oguniense (strain DSM 13380 / JCM 10595 / TE7) TaxID=698757 RepID=H6QAR7_PYROT|nr:hypothetical protein Pogu_1666 [Pyrobaculum oguniense TE7]